MRNQQRLLNASHIVIDGLFESVPMLLSFMLVSFGANEKEAGVIISLASMGSTLGGLFTICLSRYLGLLRTISLVIFLYGIGFFTNAFSNSIYLTGSCFILAISGYCLFHNLAFTYLTIHSARECLGKTMSNFTAVGDLGRIPFVSLASFAAAACVWGFPGWRIVCGIYGLGAIGFAGYLLVTSYHPTEKSCGEFSSAAAPKRFFPSFSLLRKKQFALPITATIFDAIGSDQLFVFLPYLLLSKGIDAKIMGTFALAFTCGCFFGKVMCGRIADRLGPRKVFVVSEIAMAALLIILLLGQQILIIAGTAFFLGIVTKGTVPVIQTLITEPVREPHQYNDIIAVSSFMRGTVSMLTPLIFGFIAAAVGVHWLYATMALAASCAVVPALKMKLSCPPLIAAISPAKARTYRQ